MNSEKSPNGLNAPDRRWRNNISNNVVIHAINNECFNFFNSQTCCYHYDRGEEADYKHFTTQ